MVFLTLRSIWLGHQRRKANRIDKVMKPVVKALSPKSIIRYGATSRSAYNSLALERGRIAALKRILRRRVARMKHFNTPPIPGARRFLRPSLQHARTVAITRAGMSPSMRRRAILIARTQAARNAFWKTSPKNQESWNRFIRIHVKSGGSPSITLRRAVRMYN
jgi:hypothetical protein